MTRAGLLLQYGPTAVTVCIGAAVNFVFTPGYVTDCEWTVVRIAAGWSVIALLTANWITSASPRFDSISPDGDAERRSDAG